MSNSPRCVVLGGSGFLGQRLCPALLKQGFSVMSVSRSGLPSQRRSEGWWQKVQWVRARIGDEASIGTLQNADFLVHLASSTIPATSNADMIADLEGNVVGTVRLLKQAVHFGVRRVIFVSSGGTVYGDPREIPITETHPTEPLCSYGIHKLAIEKYLNLFRSLHNLDSLILRVSNMYGESQSWEKPLGAIAHFTHQAVMNEPIQIWGDGMVTRDYVHVDDVVTAILNTMRYAGTERVFNIGTGHGASLNDLVALLRASVPKQIDVRYYPARAFDVPVNILDPTKAQRELLWHPEIQLEGGVQRVVAAFSAAGRNANTDLSQLALDARRAPEHNTEP